MKKQGRPGGKRPRCSGFLAPSGACPVGYVTHDQWAANEPAAAALLAAVWVAYQGDGLAGRPGKVPGVVLLAAWVSGLESRPFNNSTQRYRTSSLGAPCSKVRVGERWLSPFRAGGGDMPPRGTAPRLHGEVGQPDRRDPGRQRLLPSRRNLRLEDPPTTCVSECS